MSNRRFIRRFLLLALAGVQLAGCQSSDELAPPRRIFLVTVDTLRADHLGTYGYERQTSPAIDRLGAQSVRFERAIAQWPLTGPSFASLMSGLYPRTTGRMGKPHVSPPDGVTLLPEYLRAQGYTTLAVVSNRVLARKAGWDRGFDEYMETWAAAERPLDDPAMLKSWLRASRVNELALPLLERHRDADRLFVWLHYSDPHTPYTLPADFDNLFVSDDSGPVPEQLAKSRLIPGLETVGDYVAHYDANILIADRGIGEALDRARELGLLEDALVIFTADHGESLGEHDYFFRHGRYPYNASSHVPLLIHDATRFPAGSSVAQPVELIDLYPTLRELVTPHAPPADMPGSSLVSVLLGEEGPDGIAFAESEHGKSIFLAAQSLEWKLILRLRPRKDSDLIAGQELYRLADDPLEKHNLIETQPEESQVLRRLLGAWLADTAKGSRADSPEVDEEMRQALEALGYLD